MATRTDYLLGVKTKKLGDDVVKAENYIDLAANNSAASDVIQAIEIPKGAIVFKVGVYVKTAEGGALTATVGDTTTAAGWDASVDLNATGNNISEEADTYGKGKLYTADDTIDLTMSAAIGDAAQFSVYAIYAINETVQNA